MAPLPPPLPLQRGQMAPLPPPLPLQRGQMALSLGMGLRVPTKSRIKRKMTRSKTTKSEARIVLAGKDTGTHLIWPRAVRRASIMAIVASLERSTIKEEEDTIADRHKESHESGIY
ncbi:hypothetical protein HAX54_004319 [Datura stramonium]|uniref:Uncharacterized protein n=1 Tax=Datura stramonium TaxID=4076 RepID=A0ABS8WWW3_DATST|nr:hypothetical protein [Datura stramonium]